MLRRWILAILMAACGVLVAVTQLSDGLPAVGGVELVVFLVLALLLSPWAFPRSVSDAEARRVSAVDGRPIVYWRPGCRYCLQLRFSLGRLARRAHWVDIWHDPAAAATVRTAAGGNETVPTVMLGEQAVVNPDRAWFRQQLRSS
ncbi:glutaredoxin domain-containing protein [Micromonospora parva]|uniref:glutaredoxin domain-containing protein n=1 Tax=Micromonospora parva TaxID=1464048 RepID=UPI003716B574